MEKEERRKKTAIIISFHPMKHFLLMTVHKIISRTVAKDQFHWSLTTVNTKWLEHHTSYIQYTVCVEYLHLMYVVDTIAFAYDTLLPHYFPPFRVKENGLFFHHTQCIGYFWESTLTTWPVQNRCQFRWWIEFNLLVSHNNC